MADTTLQDLGIPDDDSSSSSMSPDDLMSLGKRFSINQPSSSQVQPIGSSDNSKSNGLDLSSISKLFGSANQDINDAKNSGLTQDQLDTLHSHEGANTWTNLFLNLIGSTKGLNAKPFMEPGNQSIENERQGLLLQNSLARQKAQQAQEEQNFGMGQLKAIPEINQAQMNQQPVNAIQRNIQQSLLKSAGIDPSNIDLSQMNNTQAGYKNTLPDLDKLVQLKNQQAYYSSKDIDKVPVQNPDGSLSYAFVHKTNPTDVQNIPGSAVPQSIKMNQQDAQNLMKKISPDVVIAHQAVKNYDTALDDLNPTEAQQANDLANRQISAIAGKFDQGVKANTITDANQLVNSIVKLEQTGEFNTPDNPAIGQAAFRRVKSALEFAAVTQAGKVRPSNFQTQFSLGNSFGSNVAGQPVPQEKIDELKSETQQNIGGTIQQALSAANNQKFARDRLNEVFDGDTDKYLSNFHNIQGPATVQKVQQQTKSPNLPGVLNKAKMFNSPDEYLNHINQGGGQ